MKKLIIVTLSLIVLSASSNNKEGIVGNWIEVMPLKMSIVQGMALNSDGTASSIGMQTLKYSKWKLNGKLLILNGQSIGNNQTINFIDTMKIVRLTADSLIFEGVKYYRKK